MSSCYSKKLGVDHLEHMFPSAAPPTDYEVLLTFGKSQLE